MNSLEYDLSMAINSMICFGSLFDFEKFFTSENWATPGIIQLFIADDVHGRFNTWTAYLMVAAMPHLGAFVFSIVEIFMGEKSPFEFNLIAEVPRTLMAGFRLIIHALLPEAWFES